jgi:2-methylisocitrate lyase-like PEP mutase family enzyme
MLGQRGICGISDSGHLATTSAGFAFSLGRGLPDCGCAADTVLSHIAEIVASVDLPVNADFESGYADDPEGVAESVRLCVETGVAGLSIEDATGDRAKPLYDLPVAVERMKAARAAIDESGATCFCGTRGVLPGGASGAIEGIHSAAAGLCGSGRGRALRTGSAGARGYSSDRVGGESQAGKRVDERKYGLRVSDLAEMGVRRISVGSSLARAAWGGFIRRGQGDSGRRKLRRLRRLCSVR